MTQQNTPTQRYMTRQRLKILEILLEADKPLTHRTIATRASIPRITAREGVRRFVEWGWVDRIACPRQDFWAPFVFFQLTQEGRREVADILWTRAERST
jgi:Fe2+ or Zn2+ uptake regulation protein